MKKILEDLFKGRITVEKAEELLSFSKIENVNFDNARVYRRGIPEAIFGQTKTAQQIISIAEKLEENLSNALITRVSEENAPKILARFPNARYNSAGKTIFINNTSHRPPASDKSVAIISAGTSDLAVVEECFETLDSMNKNAIKYMDMGVAGIHRLFSRIEEIKKATVIIVVAGMDGALPSVVAGLVDSPVIAVPTSVGYGAGNGGIAPLLAMLNSCSAGIAVMNIDNGYGAACLAAQILNLFDK